MSDVTFRSDMTVRYLDGFGDDAGICRAARVSTEGAGSLESEEAAGLINYLMKHRHGSPFEHNALQFYIEAPIFVVREFQRHRIGFSYNEMSGRYTTLQPVFWRPAVDRPLVRTSSPARPVFEMGAVAHASAALNETSWSCSQAWTSYTRMLEEGIAPEVARTVLPVGTYTSMYVTCNARSMMAFLSLRTEHEDAIFRSYPQREIADVATAMEATLAERFPLTHAAFEANGRVAP